MSTTHFFSIFDILKARLSNQRTTKKLLGLQCMENLYPPTSSWLVEALILIQIPVSKFSKINGYLSNSTGAKRKDESCRIEGENCQRHRRGFAFAIKKGGGRVPLIGNEEIVTPCFWKIKKKLPDQKIEVTECQLVQLYNHFCCLLGTFGGAEKNLPATINFSTL